MARVQSSEHVRRRRPAKARALCSRSADAVANHQSQAIKMAVSQPFRAKERARFLADSAVAAMES
jgi:hypothetical protein